MNRTESGSRPPDLNQEELMSAGWILVGLLGVIVIVPVRLVSPSTRCAADPEPRSS